jgi:predicted amidohydrolase
MRLRVAGAQAPVTDDVAKNVSTILRAIDFARREQADILLTPEGSLSGYRFDFDPAEVERALERVTSEARRAGVGLALGTCFVEPDDRKCYNELRLYAKAGAYLGFHSKTLVCSHIREPERGEAPHLAVRPLRTFDVDGVTVGALICNDLWANPEWTPMPDTHLSQQLAGMGARVVLQAVNGGRGNDEWRTVVWNFHESNLRMRARAGRLWIVVVDNCDPPDLNCSTPCGVVNPDGGWAFRTSPKGEEFFAHTIEV